MVEQKLIYVRAGALAVAITKVGVQFEEPGLRGDGDRPERHSDGVGSGSGPVVVVQQDVRDVVLVLGLVPPVGRSCLRHQEAPKSGHVDLDLAQDPAVLGA